MAKKCSKEDHYKLLCEKVLNESWSSVEQHTEEIQRALEKKELNERDLVLIKMAALAFLQKVMIDRADSVSLFGVDLSKE